MRLVRSALLLLLCLPATLTAQAAPANGKKVLGVEDYSRWRSIDNAKLSADGKWLAYGVRFTNVVTPDAKPVLHLKNLTTNSEIEIADATLPTFSADGKWIAYQVEPPAKKPAARGSAGDTVTAPPAPAPGAVPAPGAGGRGGAPAAPPLPKRWELRELATGTVRFWQDVQSVTFSPTSTHLVLRRRPPTPAAGAGAAATGANAARGVDVIVHDLASGRSQFLGSVGELAYNKGGTMLAYTVDAAVRDGNGLFLLDLAANRIDPLDNDSLRYSRLTWNDAGTGLAVLKGREVEKMRERNNRLIVFGNLAANRTPAVLDPATTAGFPKGFVVSERAALSWSADGQQVYLGIMPQTAAPDTAKKKSTDSIADVDVWRTQDERIQSQQMNEADRERNRTFTQAFVHPGRYITLTDSSMRELELPQAGSWAVGNDPRPYISDYKRPAADFYRVNLQTGERTKFLTGQLTGPYVEGISPDGRHFLYWQNGAWQDHDLAAGTSRALAVGPARFTNMEWDYPGTRPPYGVIGYAKDGSAAIVAERFDLWLVPFAPGAAPKNLTMGVGTSRQIVLRPIRTEPLDSSVVRASRAAREWDLSKPLTLSAYGEFTKQAGFFRLADGAVQQLVFDDAAYSTPVRATGAERFLYTRQTFRDFPDLLIADGSFAAPSRQTDVNPQQAEYRWGRRILFDYTTRRGAKLQGILALPDDYQPGQKLPMLVTFYEKNSQTMHRYPSPSFITGMGAMPIEAVSRGYATMLPDVFFHTGTSHSDMLDAVEAATKKVIAMGYVDPKRIGVHGHSYGGEGAAFIGTRSRLFAAVGMGAGVTDLFTDFSQSWGWSYQVTGGSGANGNNYYMLGQGRWGFSPWDDPARYHFESAITHVREVTAPFLIMHGAADPTVSFTEGMNFYNALRFNGKNAVMLAYPGEGHGLSGLANRKDLTIRYFQYFDHYLRGTPAPKWLTDGVPYIAKETLKEPK